VPLLPLADGGGIPRFHQWFNLWTNPIAIRIGKLINDPTIVEYATTSILSIWLVLNLSQRFLMHGFFTDRTDD